jgi:hypothetical protein
LAPKVFLFTQSLLNDILWHYADTTRLQAGRSRVWDPTKSMIFSSIYLILPAALGPRVYSAFNGNEYQKQTNILFLGSKERQVRSADNNTAVC